MTTVISSVHLIGFMPVAHRIRATRRLPSQSSGGGFYRPSCECMNKRHERVEPELELVQSWQPEQQQQDEYESCSGSPATGGKAS